MNMTFRWRKLVFVFLIGCWATANASAKSPNVLLILADDLGYSDLGCYGSEIKTPNLDGLASKGLRFSQFYNTGRCWPTRGALMTGYYPQQIRRDTVPGIPSGGRGVRQPWAVLLPKMLKPLGYRSYHTGKWHIDGMPIENGFDRSYYVRDQGRFFNPKLLWEDDKPLPPVEKNSGYYATVALADHVIKYLKEHQAKFPGRPFFQYLAFAAPHFPLHALPEDIARYKEVYRQDWAEVRKERAERQKKMGLLNQELSKVERDLGPPYDFPEHLKKLGDGEVNRPVPWDTLTTVQRDFQSAKMAIHAAMIDRMDREIGRVLNQIREMGQLENTIVFFLSDNGASAEIMVRDDGHDPQAPPGSAATYLCLGPGWSTTSNTPFRRHKTWTHEGGISTPLVVSWPNGIKARGEYRRNPGHVIDIVPTILELAGGSPPVKLNGKPVPTPPGKSLVPVFSKDNSVKHDYLWWFHDGHRAVQVGDWKLVAPKGEPWELYNLKTDRAESKDLSETQSECAASLEKVWSEKMDEFKKLALQDLPPARQPAKNGKGKGKAKAKAPGGQVLINAERFDVLGRKAFVMMPEKSRRSQPQPWIFYAPTLGSYPDSHENWMHQQFVDAGIAVAGVDVGEAYGSPNVFEYFNGLYDELVKKRGFAPKAALLGRSRGGLWVSSWAASAPDKVAGISGIYPVFDFLTYPGLKRAAPAYGLGPDRLEAAAAELNPINKAGLLAKAGIPVFIIHGEDDKVVPLEKNSAELKRRYEAVGRGNQIELITIKGQGHNFWPGFFHCQELVDFTIARAKAGAK